LRDRLANLATVDSDITVGQYLLKEIKALGVKQVFGIPGDMVIKFFTMIANDSELELFTFSHEPGVGFAAIGASRATCGPTVACVTYGPGALNMVNTVACAYAEKVPLIIISGGPAMNARSDDFFWHHTVKDYQSQLDIYKEITDEAVILDNPNTAVEKINHALESCQKNMLPVYIEIPADIVGQPITHFIQKSKWTTLNTEHASELAEAIVEIIDRIEKAQKPVLMVGIEAVRYNLLNGIEFLANKFNIPLVSTMLARDFSPVNHSAFYGVYFGKAGHPSAEKVISESDLILMLGEQISDVTLGAKLAQIKKAGIVECFSHKVKTSNRSFNHVTLFDLIAELCKKDLAKKKGPLPSKLSLPVNCNPIYIKDPVVSKDVIDAVNWFFCKYGELPIISDTGNCLFMSLQIKASSIIGASYYGTMGFAVPAAIGYAVSTKKRPLVLVGDGAFQMTGQELCHCPRYKINPIIIVINNRLWGMEQLFHASKFNELPNWCYANMAQMWGGKGYLCDSRDKLYHALSDAKEQKTFTLIEVVTARDELPEGLLSWVKEQKQEK